MGPFSLRKNCIDLRVKRAKGCLFSVHLPNQCDINTYSSVLLYFVDLSRCNRWKWGKVRAGPDLMDHIDKRSIIAQVNHHLPHLHLELDVSRVVVTVHGSAARDPHGIKQITVGPPHGIKQITMFIRENVECLDSSFTTTTTIK
ncbi:hypothetical protein J6590_102958, partial [Homalodisca vitripennis]